jgi:hypothetical protein
LSIPSRSELKKQVKVKAEVEEKLGILRLRLAMTNTSTPPNLPLQRGGIEKQIPNFHPAVQQSVPHHLPLACPEQSRRDGGGGGRGDAGDTLDVGKKRVMSIFVSRLCAT